MKLDNIPEPIPLGTANNIIGQRFGKLTVLYRIEGNRTTWLCKCDCGNYTKVLTHNLKNGSTSSCGCYNYEKDRSYKRPNRNNYAGQTINNFKVIEQDLEKESGTGKHKYWKVECPFCKRIFSISSAYLKSQFSCGCVKSKGEYLITSILNNNNIEYQTQYVFDELKERKFDFIIFKNGQIDFIIEYDGEQHFNKASRYYSEEGVKRDREKDNFCINKNLKLYRIPYTEYDNIKNLEDLTQDKFLVKAEEN